MGLDGLLHIEIPCPSALVFNDATPSQCYLINPLLIGLTHLTLPLQALNSDQIPCYNTLKANMQCSSPPLIGNFPHNTLLVLGSSPSQSPKHAFGCSTKYNGLLDTKSSRRKT
jgi:hypothetical protein